MKLLQAIIVEIATSISPSPPPQHDAQMDYYGKRLATCSSDRTVKIFEVVNGTQSLVATLVG